MNESTLQYYRQNAPKVSARYESADVADLHSFLNSSFALGSRLLELGCGSGRDAAFMVRQGFKVMATDGSASMVDQAVLCHPELSGKVLQLKLPRGLSNSLGLFDGIFSIAVLMHLSRQDIEVTISKINSLLVSGGRFLFSVPAQRDDILNNEFDSKGRRFTTFTESEWKNLCVKQNFGIVRTMTTEDGLGRRGIVWLNCLAEKS